MSLSSSSDLSLQEHVLLSIIEETSLAGQDSPKLKFPNKDIFMFRSAQTFEKKNGNPQLTSISH
jgi:hypothetical protein